MEKKREANVRMTNMTNSDRFVHIPWNSVAKIAIATTPIPMKTRPNTTAMGPHIAKVSRSPSIHTVAPKIKEMIRMVVAVNGRHFLIMERGASTRISVANDQIDA